MTKWFAMLSVAVLAGGCASNPSNLSWEDRPEVILPQTDPVPPPVLPPSPAPAPTTAHLPVLDPGPASIPAQKAEPVVAYAPQEVAGPAAGPAVLPKKSRGRHAHHRPEHGNEVAGTVVNPYVSSNTSTFAPVTVKPKAKARPKSVQI